LKALFIGLGSAGQRHLRNLKRLVREENLEVIAYRVRKLGRTFDDELNILEGVDIATANHIREYYDLDEALMQKPDIAIIANPNSMHIECAIKAAEAGCDLFIEKPISSTLERVDILKKLVSEKKLIAYVGYQNRFNPCVKKAKEIVEKGTLGKIFYVNCELGEDLTKMHKYEDYRGMNEAKRSTGGGVVLCQIHELDYLYWFFGVPESVCSQGGKCSGLEIEVEDNATSLFRFKRNDYEFPVVLHQDFMQYPPTRRCYIVGSNGKLEIDLLNSFYRVCMINGDCEEKKYQEFKRNDMFLEEMRLFLECVQNRTKEFVDISQAEVSLKMALAIKKSIETKKCIAIGDQ